MKPRITEGGNAASGTLSWFVRQAFSDALAGRGTVDPGVLQMDGMSGRKYRLFINNLIRSLPEARYLEVGTWAGSTLCAAISGNAVRAVAIDNWSEFGGPRELFFANLGAFKPSTADVRVIEDDFRRVDYRSIGKFNVYLFDGPHSAQDQFDGISFAQAAMEDQFVLIVDDWNWERVRAGTQQAIAQLDLSIVYSLEIRTTLDGSHPKVDKQDSDWHNGYFIAALRQGTSRTEAADEPSPTSGG
jgi:hypothetical protein